MAQIRQAALDHEARRWLRPDWRRFFSPGSQNDPLYRYYQRVERKYAPDQPRVPAGQPEGGQWTGGTDPSAESPADGSVSKVRLASSEPPKLGRHALAAILFQMAKRTIEAFRSESGLYDLFGRKDGTVSYTRFKDGDIFGSNSNSPSYGNEDRQAANQLRDELVAKYPDDFSVENLGQKPNDALYHAETTILLRAARQNGGSLAGEEFEVYVDRPMCNTCPDVLPYVGLELGNPRVTFIGPKGERRTMQNGKWSADYLP